jgi:integrase
MTDLMTLSQSPGAAALAMIERNPNLADSTKNQYKKALRKYLDTGNSLTDAHALTTYAADLPASSRAFLKAAVRLWCEVTTVELKGRVDIGSPQSILQTQGKVMILEAVTEAIPTRKEAGQKTHTWLSQAQIKQLLDTCESGIVGQRDRLLLGLLVAAGLRRSEAAALRFDDVKLVPRGDRFRTVLDIVGKGSKARTVPISDSLANAIDEWTKVVGGEGYILRSLGMAREIGESMTPVAVFNVVRKRGQQIGKPSLAPHDLRRSFAQCGFEAGVPITQLSRLLGHANVATTQRYLNLELDLETTASDFVPF